MFTSRGTPRRTTASITLKVDVMFVENTSQGVVCVGSGMAATWMTAAGLKRAMQEKATPASRSSPVI
jgi:hypothetical protein